MQRKVIGRIGRRGHRLLIGAGTWILAAGILGAGPASGAPIETCTINLGCISFSGPDGFGLEEADANLVSTTLDILIVPGVKLFPSSGTLAESILFDPVTDLDPFLPSLSGPNVATTEWTIRNLTGSPEPEQTRDPVYYAFVGFEEKFFDSSGNEVNYGSTELGLILDTADPWVILEAFDSADNPFFYPAVDLGSIAIGADADPFVVQYFIGGPLQESSPSIFVLPRFQVGAGFTVIPEPTTALILGLGLAGLAVAKPRRS